MSFVTNCEALAREAMMAVDPKLADKYAAVIKFLSDQHQFAKEMHGNGAPAVGSADYISRQAAAFALSRNNRSPKPPKTIPDEMVSVILEEYFDISKADIERIKNEHLLSMGAENLVGDLLERYLASVMEPRGWIWCSGSMVKAADFIKPPSSPGGKWRLLQVKNRDNSENSSSSKIRKGTVIEHWFRTFSKKTGSNWDAFPEPGLNRHLSEDGFKEFARKYLRGLRALGPE